ncbi:MAG: DUF72 domain-containing protein [Bacteroidetes bacterium]|nr:DUF72 domain-containing protein [Bacteroidota bacterium]
MEFGKINPDLLGATDLSLPADHADTKSALKKQATHAEIYVGCAKWGRKDWIGKLYPKGTKDSQFLELYSRQFNSIELNSTFYNTPSKSVVENWYNVTPANFLFVSKFPQTITHLKRLKDTKPLVDNYLAAMSGLKEKFGPMFLMPHPQMGKKSLDTISEFILSMPTDQQFFLELRHDDWNLKENADIIYKLMQETNTGSIITDTAGRRDMVHMRLTIPQAFIRFVGNGLHPTDYTRIDAWVLRIQKWLDQGLQKLYFFMHQHDELYSPELVKYFIDTLNSTCGLKVQPPQIMEPLF